MPIKHTIRMNDSGKTKLIYLTPSKAIRSHCIECMGFQASLVKECTSPLCPLYPFRIGRTFRRHP
jgi:hypothetical protein